MVSIWLTKVKGSGKSSTSKKSASQNEAGFIEIVWFLEGCLLAILLDAGGAQSGKAVLIDGKLPGKELVDSQRVAAASLLEGEQAAAHSGNDFGLPADNPPFGPGRGQIRNC
jgi:hypothetical protein